MLLNNDFLKKIQMNLNFQKEEKKVIMYIIEKKNFNFNHFI